MDCSPPGSSVHGILQARILEWVSFPRGSSRPRDWTHVSYWHWNMSLHWQADSWPLVPPGKPVLQLRWLIITGNYFEPWHFSSQNVLSMQNFTLSSVFSMGKSHKQYYVGNFQNTVDSCFASSCCSNLKDSSIHAGHQGLWLVDRLHMNSMASWFYCVLFCTSGLTINLRQKGENSDNVWRMSMR